MTLSAASNVPSFSRPSSSDSSRIDVSLPDVYARAMIVAKAGEMSAAMESEGHIASGDEVLSYQCRAVLPEALSVGVDRGKKLKAFL
jgi:hypothetical protein